MPVDRGAWDVEDVCDLLDGALAGVVELLCESDLLGVQLRATSALATAGASGCEPVASVGDDELALELGKDGEHPEHRARPGARRRSPASSMTLDVAPAAWRRHGHGHGG
jgi:hypothetical protein